MDAGPPELRIRLLGGLGIEVDREARELPSLGRARSLLAFLALHPGSHPRGVLAGRFWPDVVDESARTSLRTALSAVRRSLGDSRLLVATRGEVSLVAAWTDVEEFNRLIAAGRAEEALGLYRGPLLAGLEDDWVYEWRDELRDRVGELRAALAAAAEAAGDLAAAIDHTRAWAAGDPLDEAPVRELMRRMGDAGDRANAIAVYERLSERLRSQLGIAPSAATRDVAGFMRSAAAAGVERSAPRDPVIALPGPLVDVRGRRLVARAPELKRLRHCWEQACAGYPQVVLIAGDPGIGKTRVAAELCATAHREDGALVMFGRCDEEALTVYQPFVEALDRYADEVSSDELRVQTGEEGALLARLVPAIDRRLAARGSAWWDERKSDRFRLFGAVARVLREAARARPAILMLDDIHWADEPTLLLLRHLGRELGNASLLVMGTYRSTELEPPLAGALAELRRQRPIEEIAIAGLARDEVAALIEDRTGGEYDGDAAAIHERTDGNPFFVEELIRAAPRESVPPSVQSLIRRRLERLDEHAARTLATAAVAGREFSLSLLAKVNDAAEDDVLIDLERAVEASAVREVSGTPGRFAFAHALVRETAYASLSATRRARLHRRIGDALKSESKEVAPAVLAYHFTAAGDLDRALSYTVAAARGARRLAAVEAAARHYDEALRLGHRLRRDARSDATVRGLLIERAQLRHERTDFAGSARDSEAALAGARAAGDRRAEMRALNQLGYVGRETDETAALPHHEAALVIARELGDAAAEVEILSRLSLLRTVRLEVDRGVEAGERALVLARQAADPLLVSRALDALKLTALWLGDLDRLEQQVAELLELIPAERPWYRGFAVLESAFVPIGRREWPAADARLETAAVLARRAGSLGLASLVGEARSWMLRQQGRLDAAVVHARSSLQSIASRGGQFVGSAAATLATALIDSGEPEAAAPELERGLRVATRVGAPGEMLRCAGQLALVRSLAGDRHAAAAAAGEAERLLAAATLPPGRTLLICAHGILGAARARLTLHQDEAARALATPVLCSAKRAGWHEFAESAEDVLAAAGSYPTDQKTS